MSPTTKYKYTESHWMVFALQGVAMMLSGLYIMFTSREDVVHMTLIIGITLLVLAFAHCVFYETVPVCHSLAEKHRT